MPGTIDRLTIFYNHPGTDTAGNAVTTYTIRRNGVATGLTVVGMPANATVEQDLAHNLTVNGTTDVIDLQAVSGGAFDASIPQNIAATARFIPS